MRVIMFGGYIFLNRQKDWNRKEIEMMVAIIQNDGGNYPSMSGLAAHWRANVRAISGSLVVSVATLSNRRRGRKVGKEREGEGRRDCAPASAYFGSSHPAVCSVSAKSLRSKVRVPRSGRYRHHVLQKGEFANFWRDCFDYCVERSHRDRMAATYYH